MMLVRLALANLMLHPWRTGITAVALAIGIAALLFLSALNAGWQKQVQEGFAAMRTGDVQLRDPRFRAAEPLAGLIADADALAADLRARGDVAAASPRIVVGGLASVARAQAAARIYGVDPVHEAEVTRLARFVRAGRWLAAADARACVIGKRLAKTLGVRLGDKLVLTALARDGELRAQLVRVRGILDSGDLALDAHGVFVPIGFARAWLGAQGAATHIVVRAQRFEEARMLAARLGAATGLVAKSWDMLDPMAREWADFAEAYAWTMLAVVVLLVVAETLNTMMMSAEERVREFALLRALGLARTRLFGLVLVESVALVGIGLVLGIALGGVAVALAARYGMDLSRFAEALRYFYLDPIVRPVWRTNDALRIAAAATLGALVAGIWPAVRASRTRPVVALRGLV